jgi:O-acetyl-ADP-ribose deacetylase (regulator of RNase III)
MITYVEGDLFTSPAQVLVNTVNTVGVMGKGIAKEFKAIYPDMFRVYQGLCEREELTVGKLFLHRTPHKWVLNFPTKRHWRQRSRVEDIEAGLRTFVARYAEYRLVSIAFPQLGCGNGELDWETQVRPLMERYLGSLPIDVYIHVYAQGSVLPEHRDRQRMREWLRAEPASLPFAEVWDDLVALAAEDEGRGWRVDRNEQQMPESLVSTVAGGRAKEMQREDLFDLWQRFRSFGFLSSADLPKEYEALADQLLDLLESLPYVERARFAPITNGAAAATTTLGLLEQAAPRGVRLIPPSRKEVAAIAPLPLLGTGTG